MFAEKLKVKLAQAKEKYSKISANNVAVKAQVGAIHCDEFFCFAIRLSQHMHNRAKAHHLCPLFYGDCR